ncbi:hypothetical protein NCCP2145_05690 [Pseudarthrobacter sp. NCCP-2145]|nr:hypothetical protein NCCP2145_05690 [Pseudarthrobacter sp. NCCP-2145]
MSRTNMVKKHQPVIVNEIGQQLPPHSLVAAEAVGKHHDRPIIPAGYGDVVPADDGGNCFHHVLTDPPSGGVLSQTIDGK